MANKFSLPFGNFISVILFNISPRAVVLKITGLTLNPKSSALSRLILEEYKPQTRERKVLGEEKECSKTRLKTSTVKKGDRETE